MTAAAQRSDETAAHIVAPDRGKLLALDGVRGVAVLAVMASHYERFVPVVPALVPLKNFVAYGWWGVDLFFALSGFLITGVLLATRDSSNYFRSFYARRTLRIFPIYYATLLIVFLAAIIVPGLQRVPPRQEWPLYFLYATNWIVLLKGYWPPNVLGHFWSLAIEEQFYLVWPMLVLFLSRRALGAAAVGLAALALVWRVAWVGTQGPNGAVLLVTFTHLDGLVLGALCAIVYAERKSASGLKLEWVAAIPLAVYAFVLIVLRSEHDREVFYQTAGVSLLAIGFSALILRLAFADARRDAPQRFFESRPLRRVGLYSYGMYVYHVPILGACEIFVYDRLPAGLRSNVAFSIVYVLFLAALTFVIAMASYELFEKKVLELKRFFRASYARAGHESGGTPSGTSFAPEKRTPS